MGNYSNRLIDTIRYLMPKEKNIYTVRIIGFALFVPVDKASNKLVVFTAISRFAYYVSSENYFRGTAPYAE